jgi:hypothetical protein
MSAGRPTKYDPSFCDEIVAFCKDGASISSFAASIDVARTTITEWASVHPEFSLAVKRAKAAVAAWYDRTARKIAVEGGGNATICIFGLKNFDEEDFKDKVETQHSGSVEFKGVSWNVKDA